MQTLNAKMITYLHVFVYIYERLSPVKLCFVKKQKSENTSSSCQKNCKKPEKVRKNEIIIKYVIKIISCMSVKILFQK